MIFYDIYNGKNHTECGISSNSWNSRKVIIDVFIDGWFGDDFKKDFPVWLSKQKEGKRGNSKSSGLGDTIAKITKSVGIKPCGGCRKRQATLNRIFPYKPESTR